MANTRFGRAVIVLALALALVGFLPPAAPPSRAGSYEVIITDDSGDGSLRQAIMDANSNPGADTITFNIPSCGGVCVIQPASALPTLTGGEITIDGYTQPDAQMATETTSATIKIQIDGTNAGTTHGLYITSAGNVVRGLSITNFARDGVRLTGSLATGNVVSGNHIGTGADGTSDGGNLWSGVYLCSDAQENTIGGDEPGERNIISNNDTSGIGLVGSETMSNTVSGNYIGTDASGTATLGNAAGMIITGGTRHNTIGGDTPGERNLVSGNSGQGISISSNGTISNTVSGNYVGTDASGTAPLANGSVGVNISGGAQHNTVGGDAPGEGNVISSNGGWGVGLAGTGTMSNTVSGNLIGTDATGTQDLGNAQHGVYVHMGAANNTIGEGNVLSGNGAYGVLINAFSAPTAGNVVVGNLIGTDATGQEALGNGFDGIGLANGTQDNTIGPGNVIAHNTYDGVEVNGSGTMGNVITQNRFFDNNSLGIDLAHGANGGIEAPVVGGITLGPMVVTGTACPLCTVELFANGDTDGEGETYVGSTAADGSGDFALTLTGPLGKPFLTATATDPISGTSEFSAAFDSGIRTLYLPIVFRGA